MARLHADYIETWVRVYWRPEQPGPSDRNSNPRNRARLESSRLGRHVCSSTLPQIPTLYEERRERAEDPLPSQLYNIRPCFQGKKPTADRCSASLQCRCTLLCEQANGRNKVNLYSWTQAANTMGSSELAGAALRKASCKRRRGNSISATSLSSGARWANYLRATHTGGRMRVRAKTKPTNKGVFQRTPILASSNPRREAAMTAKAWAGAGVELRSIPVA